MKLSFRARLAAGTAGLMAVAFLGVGGLTYLGVEQRLRAQLDDSLRALANFHQQNRPQDYPAYADDSQKVGPCVFGFSRYGNVLYRSVPNAPFLDGRDAAFKQALAGKTEVFTRVESPLGPQRVLLAWVPGSEQDDVHVIEVGAPLGPLEDELRRILAWIGLLSAGAVALSIPLGFALADRATSPVRAVLEAARRTDAESLGLRVPAASGAGSDPIGALGATFNRMLARLEEGFERQRRFTADASHELRTPLTALRGEIELALRKERSPEAYRETLKSALEEIERLERLSTELLALSRLDAPVGEAGTSDLAAVAERTFARLAPPGASWRLEAPAAPVPVPLPDGAATRLVENLLGNLKTHAPGAEAVLRIERAGPAARLTVEDAGPGVPPEALGKLFDRFYRADPARHAPGAGLGLAIAKELAAQGGGELTAAPSPLGGLAVTLAIPLASA